MLKDQRPYEYEGVFTPYDQADIVLFGVPYDGTVSFRPGTRFGPNAVRNEMDGLETYSPYLNKDMVDYKMCDLGDVELSFGNTGKMINDVKENVESLLQDDKKTLAIGGEHLITYPVIMPYIAKYPELVVIHLDAHADLRQDYLGETLSHATVIRRVHDHLGDGRIWQFGIRSGTKEEFDFGKKHNQFRPFDLEGIEKCVDAIGNKPVYLTIDLDVLDPSIFAGTGTPEPGGVNFKELMSGLVKLDGLNIVGADVVELSPHYDQSGVSTAVACKVIREVALLLCE